MAGAKKRAVKKAATRKTRGATHVTVGDIVETMAAVELYVSYARFALSRLDRKTKIPIGVGQHGWSIFGPAGGRCPTPILETCGPVRVPLADICRAD